MEIENIDFGFEVENLKIPELQKEDQIKHVVEMNKRIRRNLEKLHTDYEYITIGACELKYSIESYMKVFKRMYPDHHIKKKAIKGAANKIVSYNFFNVYFVRPHEGGENSPPNN